MGLKRAKNGPKTPKNAQKKGVASSGGSRDIGDFGPFYGQRGTHFDSKKHRTISQLFAVVLETRTERNRFLGTLGSLLYYIYRIAAFVQGG